MAMLDAVVYGAMIALVALGVFLFVWVATREPTERARRMLRTFWCPVVRARVTAEFEECDERCVAVHACSAFSPPRAIACERACLGFSTPPLPTRENAVA